jgi:alkylation response protein AidB-like acyl-CoA dehydrogenase
MADPWRVPTLSIMTMTLTVDEPAAGSPRRTDWLAVARQLGPLFFDRAVAYDANDPFPFENYRELKEHGVFGAPVPLELGGGGASYIHNCATWCASLAAIAVQPRFRCPCTCI